MVIKIIHSLVRSPKECPCRTSDTFGDGRECDVRCGHPDGCGFCTYTSNEFPENCPLDNIELLFQ